MNKAELIAKIAEDAGITKTQANGAVDAFVDAVTKTLKKGDKVTLVGFGIDTSTTTETSTTTVADVIDKKFLQSSFFDWLCADIWTSDTCTAQLVLGTTTAFLTAVGVAAKLTEKVD